MKERKLSDKRIIDTLAKKSFIELVPICDECALRIIDLVFNVFTDVHFHLFQVEDNIYCLRINV